MKISIKPGRMAQLLFKIVSKLRRHHDRAIDKSLRMTGAALTKDLQRRLTTGGRSGRIYPYNKLVSGASDRSSAAGEMPGWVTRRLARSLFYSVEGGSRLSFGARVRYANFLEEGTRRMRKRPFLRPQAQRFRGQLVARMKKRGVEIGQLKP